MAVVVALAAHPQGVLVAKAGRSGGAARRPVLLRAVRAAPPPAAQAAQAAAARQDEANHDGVQHRHQRVGLDLWKPDPRLAQRNMEACAWSKDTGLSGNAAFFC